MEKRALGRSGIAVGPWCFGGNVFGWTADEKTSFDLLDAFVGAGFDFIDTADIYSAWVPGHAGGESETGIGNWPAARKTRDRVVIATKVGAGQPGREGRLDRRHIAASVETSLKRLQTDRIDLYQSQRDDPQTPVEEVLDAYGSLIKAGKVRAIGASNFSAARLKASLEASKAHDLPRYETLQPEYNLLDRDGFEGELQDLCVAEEVGVIPYFSLAAGFLTGKYRSDEDFGKSPRGGGMGKYMNPRGAAVLKALDAVSARHQVAPATVALAWLMTRPAIAAPIASATSLAQFEALVAAPDLRLGAEDVAELDAAGAA